MSWSPHCRCCHGFNCRVDKCESRSPIFNIGDRVRFVDTKHPKNGEICEIIILGTITGGMGFAHASVRFDDSTTLDTEVQHHLCKIVMRDYVSTPDNAESDSDEDDSDSDDENESNEREEIDNFDKYEEYDYSSCNGRGCSVGPDMCDECRMDYAEYLADC